MKKILRTLKIIPYPAEPLIQKSNPLDSQLEKGERLKFYTDGGELELLVTHNPVPTIVMSEYKLLGFVLRNNTPVCKFEAIYDTWFQTGIINLFNL